MGYWLRRTSVRLSKTSLSGLNCRLNEPTAHFVPFAIFASTATLLIILVLYAAHSHFPDHRANCNPQSHLLTLPAAESRLNTNRTGSSGVVGSAVACVERLPGDLRICGGRCGVLRSRLSLD